MVNLHLLARELAGSKVMGAASDPAELDLDAVRLYNGALAEPEAGCLYVLENRDAAALPAAFHEARLAVVGACGDADPAHGPRRLALPGQESVVQAFTALQEAFERYERLSREITETAARTRDINAAFSLAASVMDNPVALFDASISFLGEAGPARSGRSDSVWDGVIENGYSDLAVSRSNMRLLEESSAIITMDLGGLVAASASIHHGGDFVGSLGATDLYVPMDESQIAAMAWTRAELERIWPIVFRAGDSQTFDEQVIDRLVHQRPVDRSKVERFLFHRGWHVDDSYRLVLAFRVDDELAEAGFRITARQLARIFPLARAVLCDGAILIVCRLRPDAAAGGFEKLSASLREADLQAAVSEPVSTFMDLSLAYAQCRAIRSAARTSEPGAVTMLSDVLQRHVIDALAEQEDIQALCHPGVLALARRKNGMDFVHDLRLYLIHGRNLSQAARALCVHRNTLVYRVEQIERTLGIELGEADEQLLFHLYLSCIILEEELGA